MRNKLIVLVLCALTVLAIGAAPRYLEELRIGGGYGEPVDGGAEFERDGDIRTDGDIVIGEGKTFQVDGVPLSRSHLSDGIPDGASANATLRWDGSNWVANNALKSDGVDSAVNGLTVEGATPASDVLIVKSGTDGDVLFKIRETSSNQAILYVYDAAGVNTIRFHSTGDNWFNAGNLGVGTDAPSEKLDVVGAIQYAVDSIVTNVSDGLGLAGEVEGSSPGEESKSGDGYSQAWSNAVTINNARAVCVVEWEAYIDAEAAADTGHVRVCLGANGSATASVDGTTFLSGAFSDNGTTRTLSGDVEAVSNASYQQYRAVLVPLGVTASVTYYVNIDIEGDTAGADTGTTYIRNMYVRVNG